MAVTPTTDIKLLIGVPLDSSYRNTLWFDNATLQYAHFISYQNVSFSSQSYQRVNNHVLRVQARMSSVYNCNYMMFRNTASTDFPEYEGKWYYCFVLAVNYVNENTVEIVYTVDVMQTWLTVATLKQCFVEREHVTDDSIGANTVPENLNIGEPIAVMQHRYIEMPSVIATISSDTIKNTGVGNIWNPLDSIGMAFSSYDEIGTTSAKWGTIADWLESFDDTPEKIGYMGMGTAGMVSDSESLIDYLKYITIDRTYEDEFTYNGDSYVPKNNKLRTYPYTYFTVDNFSGDSITYHWEDFKNASSYGTITFCLHGTPYPRPILECYPLYYKGRDTDIGIECQEWKLVYGDFPQIAFPIDTYKAWVTTVAQKQAIGAIVGVGANTFAMGATFGRSSLGMMGVVLSMATALSTSVDYDTNRYGTYGEWGGLTKYGSIGLGSQAGMGALNSMQQGANLTTDMEYHQLHSNAVGSAVDNACLNFSNGNVGFREIEYSCKPEYARQIDEFFTMFGYQINRVKVPNRNTRPHFNYVKTRGCTVTGNIPAQDRTLIEGIYDAGITFWKDASEVGDYSVDNSPT